MSAASSAAEAGLVGGAVEQATSPPFPLLLVVDDDDVFRAFLAGAMRRRGYAVVAAASVGEALALVERSAPQLALLDLDLRDGCGLEIVPLLRRFSADVGIVVLTGRIDAARIVAAARVGKVGLLAKPVDVDEIEAALLTQGPVASS